MEVYFSTRQAAMPIVLAKVRWVRCNFHSKIQASQYFVRLNRVSILINREAMAELTVVDIMVKLCT